MIYASDLTPLVATTYPNHRGQDGKMSGSWPTRTGQMKRKRTACSAAERKGFTLHAITNYDMPAGRQSAYVQRGWHELLVTAKLEKNWKGTYATLPGTGIAPEPFR